LKKGKRVLAVISLIIFICALIFVAYELFKVRKITVTGCETRSQDDIITLSSLEYDESIFLVDKQEVMDALALDPYIKPVEVQIKYPDNVLITIEERKEAACIEKDGAFVVIDHEGWVLRVVMTHEEAPYLLVTGLPADSVEVGNQIGTSDTFKIGVLTRVLDALAQAGFAVNTIDVSLAADIVITLSDSLIVELGDDTNLSEKFRLVEASKQEIAQLGKTGGILDVSSVKNAYYREN
jgi:cell division septal protein FtsQ